MGGMVRKRGRERRKRRKGIEREGGRKEREKGERDSINSPFTHNSLLDQLGDHSSYKVSSWSVSQRLALFYHQFYHENDGDTSSISS